MKNKPLADAARAYVTLPDLIGLEHTGRRFSFLPRQPAESLLSGRHASRLRGRGLSFEELRVYRPGDDIRSMDWRATARLRQPYVRVFSEERDRPTMLLVDQRSFMFFGSSRATKSVLAAEMAALAAWSVLSKGDRIGAVLLGEGELVEIRPQRSRATVLRILGELARLNGALPTPLSRRSPEFALAALKRVRRMAPHDALILTVTDAQGLDDREGARLLTQLAEHNDVIATFVYDPLESELPAAPALMATDGKVCVEIPDSSGFREQYRLGTQNRILRIRESLRKLRVPIVPLSTHLPIESQLRDIFGRHLSPDHK